MRRIGLTLLAVILAAACGNEAKDEGPWLGANETTGSAQHPGSPGGEAVVPEATAGTTVVVILGDGRIALRESAIPRGPAVLTITNGGKGIHDLHVEGPGVQKATDGPIDPGGSRSVSVELQPGTYTLYCPVPGHRDAGEETTFTAGR